MKKTFAVLAALLVALVLVGCGASKVALLNTSWTRGNTTYTFKADNVVETSTPVVGGTAVVGKGTWMMDGDKLTIDTKGFAISGDVEFGKTKMVVKDPENAKATYVFTRVEN